MSEPADASDYQFEFQFDNLLTIRFDTHCHNSTSQPRIRWKIENTDLSGDNATIRVPPNRSDFAMPYATLDVSEPHLIFGENESSRPAIVPESRTIDTEQRETIALPDRLAANLRDSLEELGTVAESGQLCADPSAFPPTIYSDEIYYGEIEWEPVGWESARNVMWYADRQNRFPERSYQIENGELIWREFDVKTPSAASRQTVGKKDAGNPL